MYLMAIVIRRMEAEDIDVVQQIVIRSWYHTYKAIIPIQVQDRFLSMAYNKDTLKVRLESSHFYVAEVDGQIVGFANFSNLKDNDQIELAAIYVLPDFQNRGIGSKLLEQGIKELSPKEIYTSVESENTIGRNFYKGKKFEVIENIEEDFFGHKLKATRMVLRIK